METEAEFVIYFSQFLQHRFYHEWEDIAVKNRTFSTNQRQAQALHSVVHFVDLSNMLFWSN